MTLLRDPASGISIVHVIPRAWGPFVDIRAMWRGFAARHPGFYVIDPSEYEASKHGDGAWWDPDVVFVLWDVGMPPGGRDSLGVERPRRCRIAAVYSEALDHDPSKLLPDHQAVWDRFKHQAPELDLVLAHTPNCAEILRTYTYRPADVLPVGWDALAMGAPRWDAAKHQHAIVYGSMVGRRSLIVPYLMRQLGTPGGESMIASVSGTYGRALLGALDTAHASLYIAHSPVASFSTWRLWQVASTSAALVAEPGDSWPFVAGEHYVPLTPATVDNAPAVAAELGDLLRQTDRLNRAANAAHALARQFTLEHVVQNYLIPALAR